MTEAFADTNLFMRILTDDDFEQAQASRKIIERAKNGELILHITALLIAEIVWNLESSYNESRVQIREYILSIINTPGIVLDESEVIAFAIDLYVEKNIDYIDAYHISWMIQSGLREAYTFDKRHFSRSSLIKVHVPK